MIRILTVRIPLNRLLYAEQPTRTLGKYVEALEVILNTNTLQLMCVSLCDQVDGITVNNMFVGRVFKSWGWTRKKTERYHVSVISLPCAPT